MELRTVEEAFESALLQPPEDRIRWVQANFGGNRELCNRVLDLLAAHQNIGDFLAAPLLDFRGQRFGPYTADAELGRGGMSIVYKGRRSEGDFDKDVAIKVVLVQESELSQQGETQILARLEHPNIAQLLDAGVTALGFRYLVMEYVVGQPVTEYCQGKPEAERLRIFLDVCRTVHYAHRSLVVHRDLKPENIFVTAEGRVKLLDFGIAKMLTTGNPRNITRGVQAFSPDYASPEQILGRPVTTATDVYSLGVLLCELLTGKPPRAISQLPMGDMVERARIEAFDCLPPPGDLLEISRKALRLDPQERYESAAALAREVERYLQGLPIDAHKPTLAYTAGKFVRRHRFSVALALLVFVALVAITAAAVVQTRLATARLNTLVKLQRLWMFQRPDDAPGEASRNAAGLTIKFLSGLAAKSGAEPARLLNVARYFHRMAIAEPAGAALPGDAEFRSLEIARAVLAKEPANAEARAFLLDTLALAATAHLNQSNLAAAFPLAEEGLRLANAIPEREFTLRMEKRATAMGVLGRAYSERLEDVRALNLFEQSLQIRKELYAADSGSPVRQRELAEAHRWLSTEFTLRRDRVRALEHILQAFRYDDERYASYPREAATSVANDAFFASLLYQADEHWTEAMHFAERIATLRRQKAKEHPEDPDAVALVISSEMRVATLLQLQGRWQDAHRRVAELGQAAEGLYRDYGKDQQVQATWINLNGELAHSHLHTGNRDQACFLARKTLAAIANATPTVADWVENAAMQADAVIQSCPAETRR